MHLALKRLGISGFESLLGLGLLAVIVLVVLPPLHGGLKADRSLRTVMEAEMVARAVLDYHSDTGKWPVGQNGQTDLAKLLPTRNTSSQPSQAGSIGLGNTEVMLGAMVGTNGQEATERPKRWLKELPIDPWGRPFRVVVLGVQAGVRSRRSSSGYPDEPPAGTSIIVISAGPNGLYDTDLNELWSSDLTGRLNFRDGTDLPEPDNSFCGDDLGFVLSRSSIGGNQ